MARPRKQTADLRTEAIRFYAKPSEKLRIQHAAAARGLTVSDYARLRVLKAADPAPAAPAFPPVSKEIINEIRRIGANINQAVRRFHQTDRVPPELPKAAATIERILRKYIEAPHGPEGP